MKRLFVCFVLFNLCACQSKGVQKVAQKSDMVTKTIPAVLDSQCRFAVFSGQMSQEQRSALRNMQFEFRKTGIDRVECLSARTLEAEERKKKESEVAVKPGHVEVHILSGKEDPMRIMKIGLVEFLTRVTSEPSKDDEQLASCLKGPEPEILHEWKQDFGSRHTAGIKDRVFLRNVYMETFDWFDDCIGAFKKFETTKPGDRPRLFPYTTVQPSVVSVRLRELIHNYAKILLMNIQMKKMVVPYFFHHNFYIIGRQDLTDELIGLILYSDLRQEDLQPGLTMEKLYELRRRGVNEFYAWWMVSKDRTRNQLHESLCSEVNISVMYEDVKWKRMKKEAGLTKRQREKLQCDFILHEPVPILSIE